MLTSSASGGRFANNFSVPPERNRCYSRRTGRDHKRMAMNTEDFRTAVKKFTSKGK